RRSDNRQVRSRPRPVRTRAELQSLGPEVMIKGDNPGLGRSGWAMKTAASCRRCFVVAILPLLAIWAQEPPDVQSNAALERVLDVMDNTAANFRSTEASFVWDQYTKVVNKSGHRQGREYFCG